MSSDIKKHKTAKIDENRHISEQKRVEEQSRAASLYARSLIEASIDPLVTISPDGKITDVNKTTELVTGVSREQLIGSDFSEYFTEPEKAREGYQEVFTKGFVKDYPLTIRHTSGRVTEVLYNASVYKNEAGEVQGVFAAARDITERMRAEEAMRRSEERYRSLVIATAQIVWTTNAQGEVVDDIPTWRAFTGQSEEEIKGWGWSNALHPEDRERTAAIWRHAVETRALYDTEYRVRRYDGEYRYLAARGVPVVGKDGSIREWVGTCTDITERKRAEEQLHRAHQELEVRVQERTAELTKAMELLKEQQKAFMEVAVPVVKVWNRVLLVPLIGVFDSARAQLTMETLLTEIENTQAKVAILDVSGIPVVDSLVAKHLIRTVSAVKLMGAECIVTGIRSRISQTIVQLGIDLSGITTRTALAEGLKVALDMTEQKIVPK